MKKLPEWNYQFLWCSGGEITKALVDWISAIVEAACAGHAWQVSITIISYNNIVIFVGYFKY